MSQALNSCFVVVEGIDGVGKSTLINSIEKKLASESIAYCITREPGGTPIAEKIRQVLIQKHEDKIYPITEVLLANAARAQHIQDVILPSLAEGKVVVTDRFIHSTWCYNVQPYLEEYPGLADVFMGLMPHVMGNNLPEPITFLLQLPEEVRQERIKDRNKDRLESLPQDKLDRVKNAYDQLVHSPSVVILDATKTVEELTEEVFNTVQTYIKHQQERANVIEEVPVTTETEQVSEGNEPTDEPVVEEFNLEEALEKYTEQNIIPELFEGDFTLVPYYKDLAKKIVRKIYEQTGDTSIFHPARVGELNREIHSMFHFYEKLVRWKECVREDSNVETESAVND